MRGGKILALMGFCGLNFAKKRLLVFLGIFLLTATVLTGGSAWALGLGDIEVKTLFNKKFHAVIAINLDSEEKDLQVVVGTPSDYELMQIPRPQFVDTFTITIEPDFSNPGVKKIVISSTEPIVHPSFNLIIRASVGGGTILESYFLALDFKKSLSLELPEQEKFEKEPLIEVEQKVEPVEEEEKAAQAEMQPAEEKEEVPPATEPAPEESTKVAEQKPPATEPIVTPEPVVEEAGVIIVTQEQEAPENIIQASPAQIITEPDETPVDTTRPEAATGLVELDSDPAKNRILVRSGDTLLKLVKRLGNFGNDLARVAVAMFVENERKFNSGNINRIKIGSKLSYNMVNDLASQLTKEDAKAFIAAQNAEIKRSFKEKPFKMDIPLVKQVPGQEVFKFLEQWKKHWMEKDHEAFSADYSGDYKGPKGRDKKAWMASRKQFNLRHKNISLLFENINIVRSGRTVSVYFTQWFKSDSYSSKGIKYLILRPSARNMKIVFEQFIPRKASGTNHQYLIHVASYKRKVSMRSHIDRLERAGFTAFEASSYNEGGERWYRLYVGRLSNKLEANHLARKLKQLGEPYAKVLRLPFALEVAHHADHNDALAIIDKLVKGGLSPYMVESATESGNERYGIYLGAFASETEAERTLTLILEAGFDANTVTL